jgi:molybdopterin biosynthesis enzyme MoaB
MGGIGKKSSAEIKKIFTTGGTGFHGVDQLL